MGRLLDAGSDDLPSPSVGKRARPFQGLRSQIVWKGSLATVPQSPPRANGCRPAPWRPDGANQRASHEPISMAGISVPVWILYKRMMLSVPAAASDAPSGENFRAEMNRPAVV